MKANEFFKLPEVQAQLDIQKSNRFGSEKHIAAFYEIKSICAKYLGDTFANEYFGTYE
jgi:hypothetical protein